MSYPLGRYWFILIFARPGNCKSLEQARMTYYTFQEYHDTEKRYPELKKRLVYTNARLNDEVTQYEYSHNHLVYWDKPDDFRWCRREDCWHGSHVHPLHDVDLFIDEGSTLFPADKYADTPYWLRKMWSQHRHRGIRIVMLTQDYKGVDINCRRMVWQAYWMRKRIGSRDISPTLPALYPWSFWNMLNPFRSVVWGVYTKQPLDPSMLEENSDLVLRVEMDKKKKSANVENLREMDFVGRPEVHFITWWKTQLYDTTADIKEFEHKVEYAHIEGKCEDISCGYKHVIHKKK